MPSPFPGMDPWLENPARWGGVHTNLLVAIQVQFNRLLPADLVADIDEYVWVTDEADDDGTSARRKPDVIVPEHELAAGRAMLAAGLGPAAGGVAVSLPQRAVRRHRYLKVITADGRRVLTAVEVLSPSNKQPGPDRDAYLNKRREYFAAQVNLVEIDLLRDGDRMPFGKPRPPVADYYLFVSAAGDYPAARVWPFSVREPIPAVPVPLRPGTPPPQLDLRACLDVVYENGRYDRKLNYAAPATPELNRTDAAWAAELLADRTRTPTQDHP